MNTHYETLINFLDEASIDATINGESDLFREFIEKDCVLENLIEPYDDTDKICVPMLQNLSFIWRVVEEDGDHLHEGKFLVPSQDLIRETRSVKKHNKLPEFVFDLTHLHLLIKRLSCTTTIRAGHESRKEGRLFREQFKERLSEIEKKRLELQKEKQK
ncbi:LOW QUALITY PROTEIN: hypothetical protein KUTeg_018642 [Tegillarca granosa]|uniref:Uncharacterized protein n=1 Tax=Tegillarca granosa TaxID=220873 RepID=A0ABQ9EGD5_TEGGR|nr:LOW QUALITY PROTEIN: hypothetical protein KUTeg_018642 [Tegillarca granosa]